MGAEETGKKPLDEVFDSAVVVPFDYHDKVFIKGQKTDLYTTYKIFQKNGRVLVPVRLMGYLVGEMDRGNGYWESYWNPQKPDDVIISNNQAHKIIKFKVNSNVMYINNEPKTLDVPLQKLEGRLVLPLRSISEALNKKIEWVNGLIVISNELIDVKSPQTLKVAKKIKARLVDSRKDVAYEKQVTLLTIYGDIVYFSKSKIIGNRDVGELFKKAGNQQEFKVALPGEEDLRNSKVINNELYYISKNNGKSELYVFNFTNNKSRKLCALGQWNPEDGWLGNIKYINNELYIILHTGDVTMGSDALYKVENGQLKEITGAKSFINFDVADGYFFYTDFGMFSTADNFFKVNMKTGQKEGIGENGFSYGIFREGGSYTGNSALFIKDGYIYTLGYKESDPKAKSAVYKISLTDKTQIQLTQPAKGFWLVNNAIYYLDLSTGYIAMVDLQGNNKKTIIDKRIVDVKFYNGDIYYTACQDSNTDAKSGTLYKYNINNGQKIKLSEQSASEFYVGKAGVFYKSDGYDLGLYKIDAKGKGVCLVADMINTALLTDAGLVYTLRYVEGVYTVR